MVKKQVYRSEVVHPENPQFVEEDFLIVPTFDEDGVQATSGIGKDGKEYPDPVPMSPPVGFDAPPDLMSLIRTFVRSERLQQSILEEGYETFEEADDLDMVEDDAEFGPTPYEAVFDPQTGLPVDNKVPDRAPDKSPSPSKEPPSEEGGGDEGGGHKRTPPRSPQAEG